MSFGDQKIKESIFLDLFLLRWIQPFLSNRLLFNFNPCEEEISFGWNFESLLISDKLNVSEIGFGILETSDNKFEGTFCAPPN